MLPRCDADDVPALGRVDEGLGRTDMVKKSLVHHDWKYLLGPPVIDEMSVLPLLAVAAPLGVDGAYTE